MDVSINYFLITWKCYLILYIPASLSLFCSCKVSISLQLTQKRHPKKTVENIQEYFLPPLLLYQNLTPRAKMVFKFALVKSLVSSYVSRWFAVSWKAPLHNSCYFIFQTHFVFEHFFYPDWSLFICNSSKWN